MTQRYDFLICGSGFAGSLLALIIRKLGKTVALLEAGKHPRFAIGESSTPLANLLLEELSHEYGLDNIAPLAKWGTWQAKHPNIACGLKRGFTFYSGKQELLVAASPNNAVADTHWFREEFDLFLLNEAISAGADYFDKVTLTKLIKNTSGITAATQEKVFEGSLLIDASGPRGVIHKLLKLEEAPFPNYPETKAVFSHFRNVPRLSEMRQLPETIYPVDDAAVHHIFEHGWVWVLRFNNGITSAGAAFHASFAKSCDSNEEIWTEILKHIPVLQEQFTRALPIQPFRQIAPVSHRSKAAVGNRWLLLPSSAGFVDPLLSTGFPLTLLGIRRIANWIKGGMEPGYLPEYQRLTLSELDYVADIISALYANLDNFGSFRNLTLLYFAAASYSETALRLGKPELIGNRFLLADKPEFAAQLKTICDLARKPHDSNSLASIIRQTIEPFDIAGLTKHRTNHQYPVDFEDLYQSASKLTVSKSDIDNLIQRIGK